MEKISFTDMLGRHGLREAKRLKNLSIGGVATKRTEPELEDLPEDFFVDGGEGLAIDLDPDGMQELVDRAIQDPAS